MINGAWSEKRLSRYTRARLNAILETGRDDLVVDAPAHVLVPGLATIRPPGVLFGTRFDDPKGIDISDPLKQVG